MEDSIIHCPICCSSNPHSLVEEFLAPDNILYKIYRCRECDVQFSHPLRYTPDYYDSAYSNDVSILDQMAEGYKKAIADFEYMLKTPKCLLHSKLSPAAAFCIRWLSQYLPKKSGEIILDYGCGVGLEMIELKSLGFEPLGIDVSERAVNILRQNRFKAIQGNTIDCYSNSWSEPSAILLLEVLEHLPDPVDFLHSIHKKFPRVPVLATSPSPIRWQFRTLPREAGDYPPNHLIRWSRKSLAVAFNKAGFRICNIHILPPSPSELNIKLLPYGVGDILAKVIFRYEDNVPLIKTLKQLILMPMAVYLRAKGYSTFSIIGVAIP